MSEYHKCLIAIVFSGSVKLVAHWWHNIRIAFVIMATIDKRLTRAGKAAYRVQVRRKGASPETATFARLTDARAWAQSMEAAIREGRHFKSSESKRHTLAELIDRYLREVMPGKPKSVISQTRQLLWWRAQIGRHALADVTPALIVEHRNRLAAGMTTHRKPRAPATVNRYLAALSHAFTVAVKEWQWLESSPMQKVTRPREPRGRIRFLSDAERVRLLAECKASANQALHLVFVLALSTGARKGELMNLRWPQVDLGRKVITLLETKNGEIRSLPLAGLALDLVSEWSRVRRLDTDLVFPGTQVGKPVDIRQAWAVVLERAGIADFHFHDLRHSCASELAMNGASLAEIAEVLGHRTLQMVRRYAHLSEAHTAGVVESMNRKIFGS